MTQDALIIAHGQPSDPAGPEAELKDLAEKVSARLPAWRIRGATLATPGALDEVVQGFYSPVVFPMFMSDGWFTQENLPRRLDAAGHENPRILTPFGLLPEVSALALRLVRAAAAEEEWAERDTTLILAAHGSGRSRQPAETARATADFIKAETEFADIRVGFIEEDPALADQLRKAGKRALLLPLFVARWGHVMLDIPAAVAEAKFKGRVLPALGQHPDVPAIIAAAIAESSPF